MDGQEFNEAHLGQVGRGATIDKLVHVGSGNHSG